MPQELEVGEPQRDAGLTIFPLLAERDHTLPYRTLREALKSGDVEVVEIGRGSVGEVLVRNQGPDDVLVLDGEQLIGAKQNRTTSRSILLPARTDTTIPVACMEKGRWRFEGYTFDHAPRHSPSHVRRKVREVEAERTWKVRGDEGARSEGVRRTFSAAELSRAQNPVWDAIDGLAETLDVSSPTADLGAAYDRVKEDTERMLPLFPSREGQRGLLVYLGARFLGLDILGSSGLYARLHQQLLRGYLLDWRRATGPARDGCGRAEQPEPSDARDLLEGVADASRTEVPTAGRGTYHVLSGNVIGGELRVVETAGEEITVHLSAFEAR